MPMVITIVILYAIYHILSRGFRKKLLSNYDSNLSTVLRSSVSGVNLSGIFLLQCLHSGRTVKQFSPLCLRCAFHDSIVCFDLGKTTFHHLFTGSAGSPIRLLSAFIHFDNAPKSIALNRHIAFFQMQRLILPKSVPNRLYQDKFRSLPKRLT